MLNIAQTVNNSIVATISVAQLLDLAERLRALEVPVTEKIDLAEIIIDQVKGARVRFAIKALPQVHIDRRIRSGSREGMARRLQDLERRLAEKEAPISLSTFRREGAEAQSNAKEIPNA